MTNEVLLKAEFINKSFGPTHAVADFSMEIAPGEIRGLIVENGSGKSTFSSIVVGLHKGCGGSRWRENIVCLRAKRTERVPWSGSN